MSDKEFQFFMNQDRYKTFIDKVTNLTFGQHNYGQHLTEEQYAQLMLSKAHSILKLEFEV